jgi:UDP-GlcNAc:undecaprenyl-phosphate GlcNAc-1-phosphate transferase
MQSVVWGLFAFGMATGLILLSMPLAHRLGLVDAPNGRKDHANITPVSGGLAMLFAILLCGFLASADPGQGAIGFVLAASLLVVTGVLDDRFDLPWWFRMGVQVLAALLLVYVDGARIDRLGSMFGFEIASLGMWSVPFTVFATVGAINAVNMVDGMDGLAGSLVLTCLVVVLLEAINVGYASLTSQLPVLIGAVAGFLLLNMRWPGRKHAGVFMGNSGSAMLGLVVAYLIIRLTQHPLQRVDPVMALWVLPVPLIDCLVLMLRRLRQGRSPFSADHDHFHYLMREAGFGPFCVAISLSGVSVLYWLLVHLALTNGVAPVFVFASFVSLCLFWYWLTASRERAVGFLRTMGQFWRQPASNLDQRASDDTRI